MQNKNVICFLGWKQQDGRSNMDISLLPICNNWKAIFKLQNAAPMKLGSTFLTL